VLENNISVAVGIMLSNFKIFQLFSFSFVLMSYVRYRLFDVESSELFTAVLTGPMSVMAFLAYFTSFYFLLLVTGSLDGIARCQYYDIQGQKEEV